MQVYLDHNATTPASPEVIHAVFDAMSGGFGNAASSHVPGRKAAALVERAREQVAELVNVAATRLVWTSGSTEALNTAMMAATRSHPHLLLARTEHKAVLDTAEHLADQGVPLTWIDSDEAGRVTPERLTAALPAGPFVLAVMAANNETGVVNDIARLTRIAHGAGGLVVCDATQQVGKLPVDLDAWGVDYASASAHKLNGPQGVGVLVTPRGQEALPLIRGGRHQNGWRSGTLNVAGVVGFGVAAQLALKHLPDGDRVREFRDRLHRLLESELGALPINGDIAERLPNTLNIRIPGADADAMIVNCPEVAFSSGSACTAAVPTPSHVLLAMGLDAVHAEESVRLSLGAETTTDDVELAAARLAEAARRVRRLNNWER
ncbi:cysteine desulfurase family protein [Hoyosella subflava]|uniref:cysteine desulfurase n=1 Tax=Hoyosella subflava (strain DSM 45089 / JCM 17490 / NBRC 109087 / DQS3-9A1) TaxID=443218 RepID=F6EJ48_HOYSD|nr:cysteine desulfurase family protein [Hoyosella subflava]AEF41280.1 NifS protein [Hoyosella subflava DQS3-9A1]